MERKNKINHSNSSTKKTRDIIINKIDNSDLKNLLIKEIDKLILNFNKISNELVLLANTFDKKDYEIINNKFNNIKETIESISKIDNSFISNFLNEIIKGNFRIKFNMEEENNETYKNRDFLQKKRKSGEKEETYNVLITKIRKYKDNSGITLGYYIKAIYYENTIILGPWKNLQFVVNLKNIFIKKISELKLDDNNRNKLIEKFYENFKNKTYTKYPPL